ncbi:hypothetical protein [Streptomyces niveus]|uniref:Uncharacterized protein n=1 Tax=Streptomyces niveus TaxID=193462 RepID=A0A1U9QYQ6_STRNV|nr:hypothetical protein [Streptomyces niveus]AQU69392.1 hypothetical protein BBN63_27620 [Streptomyces niveus]
MSDETAGPADQEQASPPPEPPSPAHDPAAPAPIGIERVPTGDPEVDGKLARLGDADHLPADGHLDVYEDVHRGLRDALTALDVRPGPGQAGPRPGPSPSYDHRS